jgi:hypothetical protein
MSNLDDARANAEAAKARLLDRVEQVRARTRPQALMEDLSASARKKALQASIAALSNARVRPIVAAGVAATAIAYLFRNPILKSLRKRAGQGEKE